MKEFPDAMGHFGGAVSPSPPTTKDSLLQLVQQTSVKQGARNTLMTEILQEFIAWLERNIIAGLKHFGLGTP